MNQNLNLRDVCDVTQKACQQISFAVDVAIL